MCGVLEFTGYGDELESACMDKTITVQDVYEHAIASKPEVRCSSFAS